MTLKAKFLRAVSSLFFVGLFPHSALAANTSFSLKTGCAVVCRRQHRYADRSGELEGVVVTEDGIELPTADYLMIDASGEIGGEDGSFMICGWKMPFAEAGLFINRTEIRDLAAGGLEDTSFSNSRG